jgi:hypothetical protein
MEASKSHNLGSESELKNRQEVLLLYLSSREAFH